MARTTTFTFTGANYGTVVGSFVESVTTPADNLLISDSTFTIDAIMPTAIAGTINYGSVVAGSMDATLNASVSGTSLGNVSFSLGEVSWSNGATKSLTRQTPYTYSRNTSAFFNSSNSTTREINLSWTLNLGNCYGRDSSSMNIMRPTTSSATSTLSQKLVLDAPPTYTLSTLSIDTPYIYTGLTTASVTVSDLSAKYGGTITDVTFTIGNTSVSRADAGTLSILLDTVGTFTPTVTVTDSRGQTTTKTLDAITVNGYVAPSVSFDVDRTLASGVPDDEGTYGTVDATFTFTDVVADAVAPSVVVTDENGTQTTPTVTWYTTRASDGTLSGTLSDWSTLSSGDTVYGLIPNVNTQYSYQISVRPRDSQGTGTAITQTLASAFYTIDFLAGGHGIAFGQPASDVGFVCNMDAHFVDANSVMRSLFDFVYPVGSYYETSDATFNPNTTWGGAWILENEGQVHVSAGSNYTIGDTGGEAEHTLTINEMPSHDGHVYAVAGSGTAAGSFLSATNMSSYGSYGRGWDTINGNEIVPHRENRGGDQPHNNMQPYIVVNRWHRTA